MTVNTAVRRGRLGFTGIQFAPGIRSTLLTILGTPGSGKTAFLQSIPDCFIINADISSTTTRVVNAEIWPAVNAAGVPVEPDPNYPNDIERAKPIQLDWAKIIEKRDILIQMAEANDPDRPKVVAADTADEFISLIKGYMLDTYNADKTEKDRKESFNDFDGRWAYPRLYDFFFDDFVRPLRRAGYGVIIACQLGERTIYKNGQAHEVRQNVSRLPDNFYRLLYSGAEICAHIHKEVTYKHGIDPKTKLAWKRAETKYYFADDLPETTKFRAGMPSSIELSPENGWAQVDRAYTEARSNVAATPAKPTQETK